MNFIDLMKKSLHTGAGYGMLENKGARKWT